ncbi:MAG: 23S rRNA (guanosine(2251)-2'-O)-methyltransferase RlmB [Myxococcales bacterium]|nr:23S rRNA (guanosine(2251)-2'-O)-methyltransferase RlmB [Myxococcales bacterium]
MVDRARQERGPSHFNRAEPSASDRLPHDRGPDGADSSTRVVYGVGPVRELLARGAVHRLFIDRSRASKAGQDPVVELAKQAQAARIPVEFCPREELDQLAGEDARHQGVLAQTAGLHYRALDELLPASGHALLVALDGVEDPRNLGAILRSAYLLGAHGVIIPEHRAAEVTPVTTKASAGASELLPIAKVGNLVRALEELKAAGVWTVAVHDSPTSRPIATIDAAMPVCLVLGAEGHGVRPLVAKSCDFHAVIPMARSEIGSFNVSVAAALALYDIASRRGR